MTNLPDFRKHDLGEFNALHKQLEQALRESYQRVMAQREEILEAFIAKYGFEPDQAIQIEERTPTGFHWWISMRPTGDIPGTPESAICPTCGAMLRGDNATKKT